MIRDEVPGFRDRRREQLRHSDRTGGHQRVQRPTRGRGPLGLRRRLSSPDTATVIDNRSGETLFTDGPFLETKEYVAGLWIIRAPDLDVALKLAAEGSRACNRKVELRPFHGD